MKAKEYLYILQNILQYIDEGVHVLDKQGKTIIYNDSMAKLEKMNIKDVMRKPFKEIFKNFDTDGSTLLKALEQGQSTIDYKQNYQNKDGKKITTINTTMPIFINDEIIAVVEVAKNITKMQEMSHEILKLQSEIKKPEKIKLNKIKKYNFNNIIGQSYEFLEVLKKAKKACDNSASVLIYGETGTGKELFAQSIHYGSLRKDKPFIAQNCAALPETLLEGLLFGTSRGGFTGAVDRAGLFEQASGGTLLLDEINSMPYILQAKLLRVLQEGYIRRVGGMKDIPIDVRIIATTNEKPKTLLENNILRRDLYYRLNVISLNIIPLRERKDDILILANFFIKKYNDLYNKNIYIISDSAKSSLTYYNYPGNVRELENIIMSAISMANKNEYILTDEYFELWKNEINYSENDIKKIDHLGMDKYFENLEKEIILGKLTKTNNNITKTAKLLKIKRQTLQHKIKKYNIK